MRSEKHVAKVTYADVVDKHLVEANRTKGGLDNVGNGHGGHDYFREGGE